LTRSGSGWLDDRVLTRSGSGWLASDASLEPGEGWGTCARGMAAAVVVAEQGIGRCLYYPFATEEEAEAVFDLLSWRMTSRIIFASEGGLLTKELRRGGPSMAFETILRASKTLIETPIAGKVFVQLNRIGLESLHFGTGSEAFVSYESEVCSGWRLDDGRQLPQHKRLEGACYNTDARVFRGSLNWAPTSFGGFQRWDYELVFDERLTFIVDGRVCLFSAGNSTPELLAEFGAPDGLLDWFQEDEVPPRPTALEPDVWPLRYRVSTAMVQDPTKAVSGMRREPILPAANWA